MLTISRFFILIFLMFAMPFDAVAKKAPSLFSVNLDTSKPLKIQPDLSHIGSDLGFGVGQMFGVGARSFADTVGGQQYGDDLSRGMTGIAHNTGKAFGDFNKEAEQTLFPEMSKSFRGLLGTAINKRNAFQFGGLIALSFAISATGYYLMKFLWEVITYKVLHPKPVILLPESTYGWWDRIKRWWNKYESPVMICDDSVTERLHHIEEKTKKIRSHNRTRANKHKQLTYDNLLLCGEPGTGKTLFARVLADRTNMDIVITTAASLLQSGVQGVKHVNDIMRMARKSKYGLIIFIDEADALFVDRDSLSPDSDHYKVLSHILALTGSGSSKFMLIAATNHPKVMDSAMGRRFQDRVDMPLPNQSTRIALIEMCVKRLNDSLHIFFTAQYINHIAQRSKGLSHAEIADMINSIGKSKDGSVTKEYIDNVVEDAIQKRQKTQEEKAMREQSLHAWHQHMQKMLTI